MDGRPLRRPLQTRSRPTGIVDNLAPLIDRADRLQPKINAGFLEYAQARGFLIDACELAAPTQKPWVESAVPYSRPSGFAGDDFAEILAARAGMRRWCLEEAGMRVHRLHPPAATRTLPPGRAASPAAGARNSLRHAPSSPQPKVARDHHVQVANALYSVPGNRIGQHVEVRADSRLMRISQDGVLLREHPRGLSEDRQDGVGDLDLGFEMVDGPQAPVKPSRSRLCIKFRSWRQRRCVRT